MPDPVSIFTVPKDSDAGRFIVTIAGLAPTNPEDLKPISFSNVLQIATAFGLEEKVRFVKAEDVVVCYYRKPISAPDELIVVVR